MGIKIRTGLKYSKTATQILVILFISGIAAAGYMAEKGVSLPSWVPTGLHGTCPFGGVAALGRLAAGNGFIPRTGTGNIFALAATLGATLVFGALFCGWLCPLGSVQEWGWKLGRRFRLYSEKGPAGRLAGKYKHALRKAAEILSYMRYVVLALVLFMTYRSFNLVFAGIDPYYALFHVWTGSALPASVVVLGLVLVLSVFVYRPWCRFLCPFGAVQGTVCRFAPVTIRRNTELCLGCGACDRACLSGIKPSESLKVSDTRCNRCLACVAACPKPGALVFSAGTEKEKKAGFTVAKPAAAASIVLLSFFIPLAAGAAWKAIPQRQSASEALAPVAAERLSSVDELSGAMSIEQAAAASGMEAGELLEKLGLPADFNVSVRLRDIEEYSGEKSFRWIKEKLAPFFAE